MVVVAHDEVEARELTNRYAKSQGWPTYQNVQTLLIGKAATGIQSGVIVASFNAG